MREYGAISDAFITDLFNSPEDSITHLPSILFFRKLIVSGRKILRIEERKRKD
jgi:hypothetical protein